MDYESFMIGIEDLVRSNDRQTEQLRIQNKLKVIELVNEGVNLAKLDIVREELDAT